ncbi:MULTISPECIES: hypothetical protein [unclassified Polaribacter]|uniref:hypothetical protein n=1 Tax=unclassified Polaribacter TaxID=196858 RepID=UPI0011BFCC94|nr:MULTISPECIES: hypothetical protein [unclassified Polaribacter]TXD52945.1 hypothetical protein ES043_06090 [Polaribacter sp. IC063]TXD60964.1 hypothetical protein ES044_06375 [Polaribacter sp. IC066]
MKKFFKLLGALLLLFIVAGTILYFTKNEAVPEGKKGKEADALAIKMFNAINHDTFENTEIIEWSFRGTNFYKWHKEKNKVEVSWDENKVILNTKQPKKSEVFVNSKKVDNQEIVQTATDFFNNDSFWLVAPYKIFDVGTERRIVNHEGKDALLITYTSGGSTPGDSYLWILDDNYMPTSFKMWTSIIPIGGISATWGDWKNTESGIKLPKSHTLSLLDLQIPMGNVKAYNENANKLAHKVLKAIDHEAYKKTNFLEWSFGGKRAFKWDKENNIADVSWESFRVNLHTRDLEKSTVFFDGEKQEITDEEIITRAWDIFNNDSFWLVAPHKLFDDNVIRTVQKVAGKDALFVKYMTGGSTPGDSYLWILDSAFVPKSYKMFVPSMKMNGVSATWEDWITTESGTLLPTNHTFGNGGKLSMGEVKGYN